MNTDKQRIYNGDWKTLHPYSGSAPTDLYYITLANKVLAAIRAVETSLDESDYRKIDETEQKELACILTAYFEDIISQTGIFQAFTRIHGKRFGKPLPFYTLDEDYTPGEINIEEVQFLVWHYHMQLNNLDIPYSPTLDTFAAIASDVMEIFETEYESAPENEKLLQYFRIDEKESHNLYALHARFLWLCTQSYLFFNNGFLLEDQAESLAEEAKEAGMDEQIPDMVNLLCNDFGFNHVTEFMRLTPPRWLAEVLGEDSPLYASLSSMGHKYTGYFRYENADETITRFRHIATDRIIEATNRSLVGLPRNMKDPSLIYVPDSFNGTANGGFPDRSAVTKIAKTSSDKSPATMTNTIFSNPKKSYPKRNNELSSPIYWQRPKEKTDKPSMLPIPLGRHC